MLDALLDKSVIGYTSLGFHLRDTAPIDVDLRGRHALVTGATSGLGREAAQRLAELGASVCIVGRDPDKTKRVRREIQQATGNDRVRAEVADLSLMREVRNLAQRIVSPIHLLVNNAGVLVNERQVTREGLELTLATNLVGHFLLTNMLLDKLIASAPARIVNVSSGGMYTQRIKVDDLHSERGDYNGPVTYSRTKRGQVILTEMWAERLKDHGVVVHAMHPGWAATPGVERSLPGFYRVTKPLLRTAAQGADTIVWLCAAEEAALSTGLFWHDRQPRPVHRLRRTRETKEDRAQLWSALCSLSGWEDDAQTFL